MKLPRAIQNYTEAIKASGLSIYDPIEIGDPKLWIPSYELEMILNESLKGLSLKGMPIRTRSKVVKEKICMGLGYPIPSSFKKTQPRFSGQCFDTYIQKSNNLQIWNEELSPVRRYVLVRVNAKDIIERVKVVDGATLALLDTTGTLTQKYQARLTVGAKNIELVSAKDTNVLRSIVSMFNFEKLMSGTPIDHAEERGLMPIEIIFEKLTSLIGTSFIDSGSNQERNRGGKLHQIISKALGYKTHRDNGRFPDIANQLLEIKLQMSPTIDLGLVSPDSTEALDIPKIQGKRIRHCDVRYAIFGANKSKNKITLTHLFLVTGKQFFSRFPKFGGKVLNKKLQIPLPADFFLV